MKVQHSQFLVKTLPGLQMVIFSLCAHTAGRESGFFGVSFYKDITFIGLGPYP